MGNVRKVSKTRSLVKGMSSTNNALKVAQEDSIKDEDDDIFDDDDNDTMHDFAVGANDHTANMQTFIANYGIKIEIPGFYIQCAK